MDFKNLLWEISDNILLLTINRADKLNALNEEVRVELLAALKRHLLPAQIFRNSAVLIWKMQKPWHNAVRIFSF